MSEQPKESTRVDRPLDQYELDMLAAQRAEIRGAYIDLMRGDEHHPDL